MSNDSFKIKKSLTLTPQDLTLLVNPEAGDLACDINDLNKIKRYDANALGWTEVGSGGVGNINALLTQTFDTAALAQFTQTGLALSSSNPIDGVQSARLIHQAASSQSFKQVIAVDRKYRGDLMNMSLQVRSSATSGNLTLLVTDETNSATIMASSSISTSQYQVATAVTNATTTISGFSNVDINTLKVGMTITGSGIPTATVIDSINTAANTIVISQAATASATITAKFSALPDRKTFSFVIPTNCASLSYTVTALQEAGLPESYVDDVVIELANVSLLETSVTVPNLTAVQTYTPTIYAASGTVTNYTVVGKWSRIGEYLEGEASVTFNGAAGTWVGLKIGLPSSLSIDTTKLSSAPESRFGTGTALDNLLNRYNLVTFYNGDSAAIGVNGLASNTGVNIPVADNVAVTNIFPFSFATSDQITVNFKVPIVGWTASSSVAIPLTQSGLVQEADYILRAQGNAGQAITSVVTDVPFISNSVRGNAGSWSGSQFTVAKDGIFNIKAAVYFTVSASRFLALYVNGVYHRNIGDTITQNSHEGNISDYFTAGQVLSIRVGGSGTLLNDVGHWINITYQGSLKQVAVNTNSKITIPTSELRFEGASSRGSPDTAIVKFDTQAKIRGDAFSVVNTAANGTVITMLKAGKLDVSASIVSTGTNNFLFITKNQASLTTGGGLSISERIASGSSENGADDIASAAASIYVLVGDVIRVSTTATSVSTQNMFNLSFQEQEIQVSVSNTLPQFSESDTSLRLSGANGYGSSVTTARRFSSTLQNVGTDIEYIDSPTLGGQFIAKAAGIYNVSFSESSTANVAASYVYLLVNGSIVALDNQILNTVSTSEKQMCASWQGYLSIGDIVTTQVPVPANNNGIFCTFTISKVGKPNVTGVNVTPFVNVPQPTSQSSYVLNSNTLTANTTINGAASTIGSSGVYSYNSTSGIYTVLKAGTVTIGVTVQSVAAALVQARVIHNGNEVAFGANDAGVGNNNGFASYSNIMNAGDTFSASAITSSFTNSRVAVTATASSDQILTAPETFSTDTASLQYASSAAYTLSTLANAPVGTFITFTYAAASNTRTQTATAPTQTTADMNANGMLIYTRAYNAASTAAQPAAIAIQIGKGLKGKSLDLYKSAGKTTSTVIDSMYVTATAERGVVLKEYNESTGVLMFDAGVTTIASTVHDLLCVDLTTATSGYLVINASKNPALTGLGLNRIAARANNTSGQAFAANDTIMTYDAVKIFDTHGALNAATGLFTAPESGYYVVEANAFLNSRAYTAGQGVYIRGIKNGAFLSTGGITMTTGAYTGTIGAGKYASTVFLAKGDTFGVSVWNDAGACTVLAVVGFNSFSIVKTSV
jgi:hypothetical protein